MKWHAHVNLIAEMIDGDPKKRPQMNIVLEKVGGQFITEEMIGLGGYGTVYRGRFKQRKVAIKRLQLALNNDRELRILQQLHHPNIVKLIWFQDIQEFR
jgi:Protein kinase domain